MTAANFDAIHIDDGVRGLRFATGELEAFLDSKNALHLREGSEGFEVLVSALIADGGDDGLGGAVDGSGLVAKLGDFGDDLFDEVAGGMWTNDDDHVFR
jgi:hypothetical protein